MAKKGGPSIENMHIAFGAACVILLVSTVYAFYQDYQREYTPWQKRYHEKEMERLEKERQEAAQSVAEKDYAEELQGVQRKIEEGKKTLEQKQAAVQAATAKEREIDNKLQYASRILNGYNSDLQVGTYEVDAGRRPRSDLEHLQKLVDDKKADVYALQTERDNAQKVIDEATIAYKTSVKEHDDLLAGETDLDAKIKKAKGSTLIDFAKDAPGINFIAPNYHIEQRVLPASLSENFFFAKHMRVDRCVSCHKAINNPDPMYKERDTTKLPAVLRSHPNLETLFVSPNSKHPYEKFGCTICHQGKPMGTTFTRAAHSPQNEEQAKDWEKKYDWEYLHYWDNKMLPLQHTEASCLKCHKGLDDIPQANKLNEGRYLFRDRGCANCHMGQSGDKDMAWVGRIGPDLRRIGEKTNKNWTRNWIANPWSFRASTKMPRFFGLENRAETDADAKPMEVVANGQHIPRDPVEVEAIATYLFTASKLREEAPPAPPEGDAEAGQMLFEGIGCLGCHSTLEGKEKKEQFDFNRHGPDLSRIGDKLTPAWLYAWLKSPRNYWAETKMPNLRLSDKEAADLTAYLMSKMKVKDIPAAPDAPEGAFEEIIKDKLKATKPVPELSKDLEDPMKMLVDSLGNKVKYVYKKIEVGEGTDKKIETKKLDTGEGEWTDKQIEKVKAIIGAEKDPRRAAKAFLTGETLIQHHGCFGCHNIQGWTFAPLTCVSLAGEADKDLEKLDFGKTLNDHSIGHTKWDWFYTKIARPRVYDKGKLELIKPFDRLRMPWFGYNPKAGGEGEAAKPGEHAEHGKLDAASNPDLAESSPYGLTPHQIECLVTHILSLTMDDIPVETLVAGEVIPGVHPPTPRDIALDRGHRVIRELNCTGCHIIGVGGDIEHGAEATPGQIPAEALVSLYLGQAGNKASQELKKPGNGIYLDEDVVQIDYGSGADGLKGWLNALRGTYITDVTAPIILAERPVRMNGEDAPRALGFHFEKDKDKDPAWAKYGSLVSEQRYLALTRYFYANENEAKDAYKRLEKFFVERNVYEQIAGSVNMKLNSLDIEKKKVAKTFADPMMLKVRFQRGEGRIIPHIIQFEKDSRDNDTASQQQAPPSLSYEGGKIQPDWLYQFLHNVNPLRQGLYIRMPSFWTDGPYSKYKSIYPAGHLSAVDPLKRESGISGEPLPSAEAPKVEDLPDDAAQIVEFFVRDAGAKAFGAQPLPILDTDRELYKLGEHLVMGAAKDGGMDCTQCHAVGSKVPAQAKWAPNLLETKRRLRGDWVQRFLIYPASIYPWTNMPNNFHFDWDNYKYGSGDFRGVQENKEENVKTWAHNLQAAKYFLLHAGEADVGSK